MQSVLASEPRVLQLMNGIETAIDEASVVESRLVNIDEKLGRMREAMAQVRQKNHEIRTANDNVKLLLHLLDDLIVSHHYTRNAAINFLITFTFLLLVF